jgi:hypothetical protein
MICEKQDSTKNKNEAASSIVFIKIGLVGTNLFQSLILGNTAGKVTLLGFKV